MPKISYDLFKVIDQVFLIFGIFTVLNVVYDPFFTRKSTISEKNSLMTPFLLCSYFRAHLTTLLLKILGGRMHGPSPPQILGTVPPVPLGLRPWDYPCIIIHINYIIGLRISVSVCVCACMCFYCVCDLRVYFKSIQVCVFISY